MLISFGETYLLLIESSYSIEDFLVSFKAEPGSWAEFFANRLFLCLFGNATDLREEYELFYKDEYENFAVFLEKNYGFNRSIIKTVMENPDSAVLYGDYGSEGDYNTGQLIQYNDGIIRSINEMLAQGAKDENKNWFCY